MNKINKIKKQLQNFFDTQLNAVLATSKNAKPYCCLVSFLVTDNLRYLIFATKRDRLKYKQMVANPAVALLIDNTRNQPNDVTEAMSVSVLGTSEDIKGSKKNKYVKLLAERHPNIENFITDEDSAIIRITIEKMYIITDFESGEVFNPG